jgi:hypothetical protein
MEPQANATPAPEKKKTLFETVLTTTPVLLTVVATFMVGQSSGEMTKAQYFRSLAGQNQAKVSNQWAFFQAKRIRGTTYEVSADDLLVMRDAARFDADVFLEVVKGIAKEGNDGQGEGSSAEQKKSAAALADSANRIVVSITKGFSAGAFGYSPDAVKKAFAVMKKYTTPPLPVPDSKPPKRDKPADKDEQDKLLEQAIKAINDKESEEDIGKIVLQIHDDHLSKAIKFADHEAKKSTEEGKIANFALDQFDIMVDDLAFATRKYLRSQESALTAASEDDNKKGKQGLDALRTAINNLLVDYKTARHMFTNVRYEKEARSNQKAADLYEVKVYLSGAKSDKHLGRKDYFLNAMLIAQVGVIIASMAMAVKLRSVVWLIAALAGLVALGFGAYVYMGMV